MTELEPFDPPRTERFDLRALYETSRLLSTSLDLTFVLDNLLLTAMSKLLVTRGVVLLYDPLEDTHRAAAHKGLRSLAPHTRVDLPADAARRVLRRFEVPEALAEHRIELTLPIASGHRAIGVIGLGGKATGQEYEPRELEFIQSLVHMAAAAVHNSLMVEELQQANRDLDQKIQQLDTLFDLSQEFNATLDRDRLAKLLSFSLMGQMLVGKHAFLMRRGGGEEAAAGPAFEVVVAKGLARDALEPELIDQLCILDDLLLLQDEALSDPAWDRLRRHGLVLALPIQQHGEPCGVLCLGPKRTGQPYRPDDIDLLHALGRMTVVSIQNLHLVEEQIEKERLEKEMRLAREIQERLLPRDLPALPGLDVAGIALPSRHVGGDYFDVVRLDEHRLLLAVADVTGKGMPAALLMSNLQACLRVVLPMDLTLEQATGHFNRVICENTDASTFITSFVAIYDARLQRLDYVNAGHNPPLLVRSDGRVELLETGGLLLGVLKGAPYERGQAALHAGDVVALFTDGVTEAMSADEEEYGEARLEACLQAHRSGSAQELLDAVQEEIRRFTGHAAVLSDDLTLVVLKKQEQPGA